METFNNFKLASVPSFDTFLAQANNSFIGNRTVFFSIQATNTSATNSNQVTLICKVLDRNGITSSEYNILTQVINQSSTVELLQQKIVLKAGESLYVKTSSGIIVPINIVASAVEIYPSISSTDPDDPFDPNNPKSRLIYHVTGQGTLNSSVVDDISSLNLSTDQEGTGSNTFIYSNERVLDTTFSSSLKSRGFYISPNFLSGYALTTHSHTIEFWCYNGNFVQGIPRHIFSFGKLELSGDKTVPVFTLTAPREPSTTPVTISLNRYNSTGNTSTTVLDTQLAASKWNHVAMVVNRSDTMLSIFINGKRAYYGSLFFGALTHKYESRPDTFFYFGGGYTSDGNVITSLTGMTNFYFSHIMISKGIKYPSTSDYNISTSTRRFLLRR